MLYDFTLRLCWIFMELLKNSFSITLLVILPYFLAVFFFYQPIPCEIWSVSLYSKKTQVEASNINVIYKPVIRTNNYHELLIINHNHLRFSGFVVSMYHVVRSYYTCSRLALLREERKRDLKEIVLNLNTRTLLLYADNRFGICLHLSAFFSKMEIQLIHRKKKEKTHFQIDETILFLFCVQKYVIYLFSVHYVMKKEKELTILNFFAFNFMLQRLETYQQRQKLTAVVIACRYSFICISMPCSIALHKELLPPRKDFNCVQQHYSTQNVVLSFHKVFVSYAADSH